MTDNTRTHWKVQTDIDPAFYDLDPMNIVWHGNYIKYFELARCALLSQIGYDYAQMRDSGYVWPIVDIRIKYIQSVTFAQRIIVHAEIIEWENRLKIQYVIKDKLTGKVLTKAYTIQVAVHIESGQLCYQTPSILWACLGVSYDA